MIRVSTLVLSNNVVPTEKSWQPNRAVPGFASPRWIHTPRLDGPRISSAP